MEIQDYEGLDESDISSLLEELDQAAEENLDAFIDVITEALKNGEKVQLVGFGTFETKTRAARKGINPQTKEEIKIPASTVPGFKAGKALKDAINN